jgi:hypothetical protein
MRDDYRAAASAARLRVREFKLSASKFLVETQGCCMRFAHSDFA